jgi:hypothetical protein
MKRIRFVLGLAVLMAVVIAGPVSAQAVTETNKQTFTLGNVLDDCQGGEETIVVESIARFVTHSTTDAQGGIHEFLTLSLHGVTATDANGETVHFVNHTYEGGNRAGNVFAVPSNLTVTNTSRIISSGPSDNMLLTTLIHFTTNANGESTVDRFDFTIECRG